MTHSEVKQYRSDSERYFYETADKAVKQMNWLVNAYAGGGDNGVFGMKVVADSVGKQLDYLTDKFGPVSGDVERRWEPAPLKVRRTQEPRFSQMSKFDKLMFKVVADATAAADWNVGDQALMVAFADLIEVTQERIRMVQEKELVTL